MANSVTSDTRVTWFIDRVNRRVGSHMRLRVRIATEHVRTRVVKNISRPVTKSRGLGGRIRVSNRSKPGEFPKAETSTLLRDIFVDVKERQRGVYDGFVGTTLDYGLILEVSQRLDRSFLRRTFNEELLTLKRLLTVPVPGGR